MQVKSTAKLVIKIFLLKITEDTQMMFMVQTIKWSVLFVIKLSRMIRHAKST